MNRKFKLEISQRHLQSIPEQAQKAIRRQILDEFCYLSATTASMPSGCSTVCRPQKSTKHIQAWILYGENIQAFDLLIG